MSMPRLRCYPLQANKDYELCPTYPHAFAVPACISDAKLRAASHFRFKHRVPALTWLNPVTGAALCRSAQPLHERVLGRATPDDDEVLMAIRAAAVPAADFDRARADSQAASAADPLHRLLPLQIIDARPRLNAEGNMLKGGGFEDVHSLGGAECAQVDFMGIGNIHGAPRASMLSPLLRLSAYPNSTTPLNQPPCLCLVPSRA